MGKRRDEILERAQHLPLFRELDPSVPLIHKAQGARLFDIDNVGYLDFTGGDGSAIVGHANQYISDAVKKALTNGIPGGFHAPTEVDLAESLEQFTPWVGAWYFFRDDEEAMREAVAWSRRATGRSHCVFLGRGREADLRTRECRVVPGWKVDQVEATIAAGGTKIAALIVDAVSSGRGVIPAPDGVLKRLRDLCRREGILFIVDDRATGFRVSRGGTSDWAGFVPDAAVFGGALGGGFPIGALGLADGGHSGEVPWRRSEKAPHPVAIRAAEAVLSILKNDAVFDRLEERCCQLVEGMQALVDRFSRPIQFNQAGSMFGVYASRDRIEHEEHADKADSEAYLRLVSALLEENVLFPSRPETPACLSSAHGAKDIEETLGAFERVLMRLHQEDLP